MKKIISLILFTAILSCNSSSDETVITDDGVEDVLATLTTSTASNITENSARLGGGIIDEGSSNIDFRGVCWGFNTNPTLDDNFQTADGSGVGSFFVDVNEFQPNTIYNVRAFAQNNAGIAYGNNISFITQNENTPPPTPFIEAFFPKNIITRSATLTAVVTETQGVEGDKGFVLATFSNPTINDIVIDDGDSGVGQYEVKATDLVKNTIYYARPFVKINNQPQYGNEVTFRTTGYFGPAGGFVVYDHGETINGWRYIEASPQVFESKWGCFGNFISGTFPDIGTGKENTQIIKNNCSDSNCAARRCDNYQFGGLSDWFLGSTEELKAAFTSLSDVGALIDTNNSWTSTQAQAEFAYHVSGFEDDLFVDIEWKTFSFQVIPLRRY
jgi:hypothetical protein